MTGAEKVLIGVPIFCSWMISYITGSVKSNNYRKAWFQPPGWVFGVVWTGLYIMLGFLLYESANQEEYTSLALLITILFFSYLWQYLFVYKRNYKLAILDIALLLILSLVLFPELEQSKIVSNTNFGKNYLLIYMPFIGWLIFALLLASNTSQ